VLVSAFAFGGVPERAVKIAHAGADLYVSPPLLSEYRDTVEQLRIAQKVTASQVQALLSGIAAVVAEAQVVVPTITLRLCRDPADDMLLECRHAAKATVLMTGDKDLLALAHALRTVTGLNRLRILTPRAYLQRVVRK